MLDIQKIRSLKQEVEKALLKRMEPGPPAGGFDLDAIIALDDRRKELIQKTDELKAKRNKFSKTKPSPEVITQMKEVGERIKELDSELVKTEEELQEKLSELPNIPADDVVAGGKENNKVIKTFGKRPAFKFANKDHVELATSLKLIDYERAAKMSGAGFWCYTGNGALLEWALLNYFVKFHRDNGYEFILPPYLLNEESAYASGHLPKFREDLFWTNKENVFDYNGRDRSRPIPTDGNLCLNATSEMMLLNFHRNEILKAEELPKKYYAYSTCFRREAGSYRKEERGMVRGHQFNKIEMFQFTKPENSWQSFDELVKNAEKLVEGLGLHYQTVQLAAGDASAAMAKTCDIEVWIPSMEMYKEVSSVSNALDYQARRANIRYKNSKTGKNEFVHTLNGSGLATSRLVPAILEQFQQEDGSVEVPKVLREWVGKKKLEIKK